MTMGQRITQLRKNLGLSQEGLAEAIGVSRQAVSKWELDQAQPDAEKIVLLAHTLGVTTDQLLLGEDHDSPPPPQADTFHETPSYSSQPSLAESAGVLTRFLKKHGYKAGYLLVGYGLLLLLVAGVMFFMVHSFFSASSQSPFPGNSGGVQFEWSEGTNLTPWEKWEAEQQIRQELGGGW